MGRAVHHFVRHLTLKCAEISKLQGKGTNCLNYKLSKENVKEAIESTP
jgi:hypothetical protein